MTGTINKATQPARRVISLALQGALNGSILLHISSEENVVSFSELPRLIKRVTLKLGKFHFTYDVENSTLNVGISDHVLSENPWQEEV